MKDGFIIPDNSDLLEIDVMTDFYQILECYDYDLDRLLAVVKEQEENADEYPF